MKLLPRVLLACLLPFLLYDSRKSVTFHFEDVTSIEILTNPNGRIVEISEPKQVRKILDSFLL